MMANEQKHIFLEKKENQDNELPDEKHDGSVAKSRVQNVVKDGTIVDGTEFIFSQEDNNNNNNEEEMVDADRDDDLDDDSNDHNRWYCNICKDGGELLCCDRCPRAFHMSCLNLTEADLPNNDWYCKVCAQFLDRQKAKEQTKLEARRMREEAKHQRDAEKLKNQEEKEEYRRMREIKSLQKKAKKAIELRKKNSFALVEYKDKTEEKLGKAAEKILQGKLGETIHKLKEEVEKLEKEDRDLKKKEDNYRKKRKFPIEDTELEPLKDPLPDKPIPRSNVLKGIPSDLLGDFLSIWDFCCVFHETIAITPFTLEQLRASLLYTDHVPLITEIHMSLLDMVLLDREGDDYVSDEEDDTDESDRWQYELHHSPLTIGVPTSTMINHHSWPSVLGNFVSAIPRYTSSASPLLREAVAAVANVEYPLLSISHKIALLSFLVGRAFVTEKVRKLLHSNLTERIKKRMAFNREEQQERRVILDEEKRIKEEMKVKTADIQKHKEAYEAWVENGKVGPAPDLDGQKDKDLQNSSVSSVDENDDNKIESDESTEEESEDDSEKHSGLSRQEILQLRREKEEKKNMKRQRREELERQRKWKQTLKRKRENLIEEIRRCIEERDLSGLEIAIEKGRDAGLESGRGNRIWRSKELIEAQESLQRLQVEIARENQAAERRARFERDMTQFYVRTPVLGLDKDYSRYWRFDFDPNNIYVEKVATKPKFFIGNGSEKTFEVFAPENVRSEWFVYDNIEQIEGLIKSLDVRGIRDRSLKECLKTVFSQMCEEKSKKLKPSPKANDAMNVDKQGQTNSNDFFSWVNTFRKVKDRQPDVYQITINALINDFNHLISWYPLRLLTRSAPLDNKTIEQWKKNINTAKNPHDFINPLIAMESIAYSLEEVTRPERKKDDKKRNIEVVNADESVKEDGENEDDDEMDDEDRDEFSDDEIYDDDGSRLWPTKKSRIRWIGAVRQSKTLSCVAAALATFTDRLGVCGISEEEDVTERKRSSRVKSENEKKDRKERAAKKKATELIAAEEILSGEDDWDENCCVCHEGGELICCDGCPKAFHLICVGLKKVPKGKTYCSGCHLSRTRGVKVTEKEDKWDVKCATCLHGGELICCDGCPRAFHLACANLKALPNDDWFCMDCDVQTCGECGKGKIKLDSHVICGSEDGSIGCDRVYHLKCVGLKTVPDDDWFCKQCKKLL